MATIHLEGVGVAHSPTVLPVSLLKLVIVVVDRVLFIVELVSHNLSLETRKGRIGYGAPA